MDKMIKVKCAYCGRIFYLFKMDINLLLPLGIRIGEIFPQSCILCGSCDYVIFLGEL